MKATIKSFAQLDKSKSKSEELYEENEDPLMYTLI